MKELSGTQLIKVFGGDDVGDWLGTTIAKTVKAIKRYVNRPAEGTDCGASPSEACG